MWADFSGETDLRQDFDLINGEYRSPITEISISPILIITFYNTPPNLSVEVLQLAFHLQLRRL